jgi:hypothetical protein
LALLAFSVAFAFNIAFSGTTANRTTVGPPHSEVATLFTNVQNAVSFLSQHGDRLDSNDREAMATLHKSSPAVAKETMERILSSRVLFEVHINPEMRVKVSPGKATARLATGEWCYFLARIENQSGTVAPLQSESPQRKSNPSAASDAWLEMRVHDTTSLPAKLSGAPVEYRVIAIRTEDHGQREARISLNVGQGTQDIGFRNEVDILFRCQAAKLVQAVSTKTSQ